MDPMTAMYAVLGALGLVGADAYMNSSTLYMKTTVAPVYEARGFSHEVVEALLLGKLNDIGSTSALVSAPQIASSEDKPVSTALADAAGLSEALAAAKTTLGVTHPRLLASIVVDRKDGKDVSRIVATGNTEQGNHFHFSVPLADDAALEDAMVDVAFKAMLEVRPYLAILYALTQAELAGIEPSQAEHLLADSLGQASREVIDQDRALLENLMGIVSLSKNDPADAGFWFDKAIVSDPSLVAARLNRAFVALLTNDFEQAIELATPVVEPRYWPMTRDTTLLHSASSTLGVAYAAIGKFEESMRYFQMAVSDRPDSTSAYVYWARSLRKQGRMEEATAVLSTARRGNASINNYREVAAVHFWIPEGSDTVPHRRPRKRSAP